MIMSVRLMDRSIELTLYKLYLLNNRDATRVAGWRTFKDLLTASCDLFVDSYYVQATCPCLGDAQVYESYNGTFDARWCINILYAYRRTSDGGIVYRGYLQDALSCRIHDFGLRIVCTYVYFLIDSREVRRRSSLRPQRFMSFRRAWPRALCV